MKFRFALLAAAAACAGCGDAAEESHGRMLETLRGIAARTRDDNPWQGDKKVRGLEAELARLAPDDDERRFQVLANLGDGLVQIGREEDGLARLAEVEEMLPRIRDRLAPGAEAEFLVHEGAAWLRLGESQNCCARNAPTSCILPIAGAALHSRPEGSTRAMEILNRAVDAARPGSPLAAEARWLLCVAAMTLGKYPDGVPEDRRVPPSYFAPDEDFPRFENVAKRLGVATYGLAGGVVAEDFDGDGDVDLLVSNSDESGQIRFFRNSGDGTFAERTSQAHLEGITGGLNMAQADYDGDGFTDVLVLRGAWFGAGGRQPMSLLRNRGDGTFVDVAYDAGLADARLPTQTAAWADFDRDGRIDLFVGGETTAETRAPCRLYHNDGGGKFTDRAAAAGVETSAFVKAVAAGDYDADGFPDVYVSVLGGKNRLYRNRGDGTFEDVAERLGVTLPMASFGAFFWDFDDDGVLDLFVNAYPSAAADFAYAVGTPIACELPCLYRGDGRGGFDEVGRAAGLVKPFSPMGHNFGDLDDDGRLDLYFGTGAPSPRALMPNLMLLNRGGRRFADVTLPGGFGNLQKGHAIAFADFDEDGDLDVFAQMGGGFPVDKANSCLFENPLASRDDGASSVPAAPAPGGHDGEVRPRASNHWLAVRLEGRRSNRSAIGARIRADVVEDGVRRSVYRTVGSGGSFGANPLRQHLGLGRAAVVQRLEILWPSGGQQMFTNVRADQIVEIVEGDSSLVARSPRRVRLGGPSAR